MKKFLAMLLCVCMLASFLPATVLAAEDAHVHTQEQSVLLQELLAEAADFVADYGLTADMPSSVLLDIFFSLPDDQPDVAYYRMMIAIEKANSLSVQEQAVFMQDQNTKICKRLYDAIQDVSAPSLLAFDADGFAEVNGLTVYVEKSALNKGATCTNDETDGVVTITATSGSESCLTGTTYHPVTATITIYNDTGIAGNMKFSYNLSNCNSVTIDGAAVTTSGNFSKLVAEGEEVVIVMTSGQNTTANTLTLSNLEVAEMAASSDITVDYDSAYGSVTAAGAAVAAGDVITISEATTLTAAAKSGAQFVGWINDAGKILGKATTLTVESTGNQYVQPVFVANGGAAWFETNNGYMSTDLNAVAAKGGQVTLMNNGTLAAGTYTIPAGTTLLIPYDAVGTAYGDEADEPVTSATYTKPTVYRTLTLANGANIFVDGIMTVGAISCAKQLYNGAVTGAYGQVKMSEGSKITVGNGGILYSWGYITGSGSVEALSGGSVYEPFQVRDWRGGNATTNIIGKETERVFPFSQYYVQNIQAPLTIYAGAKEYGFMSITLTGGSMPASNVDFIGGSGAMFNVASGYVIKDLVEQTGRLNIDVHGTAGIDPIVVKANLVTELYENKIDSSKFVMPINGNMDVNLLSGAATINQDMVLLPGAKMYVAPGASCTLGNNKQIYVYDIADWNINAIWNKSGAGAKAYNPWYVAEGSATVQGRDQSASVQIDGFVDASAGYVYTTTSGANVFSTGGGQLKLRQNYLKSDGSYNHKLYYVFMDANNDNKLSYHTVSIVAAKLQNADGSEVSFPKSSGTVNYVDGVWACQHAYAAYTVAPTCTEQGYDISTCACGVSQKENYVDALGHNIITHEAKTPTCTETGWNAYETCSRCDYTTYSELPTVPHNYVGSVTTAPGCDSEGVKTFTCSACGDSYTEPVSATGHNYDTGYVTTYPTCDAEGVKTYTCQHCGDSYTEPVAALGHSYMPSVTAPTCETDGYTTFTCSCGHSYVDDVVPATGHSLMEHTGQAPTCNNMGWYDFVTCMNCDYSTYEEIPATGHSYDQGVITTEPGCESEGVKTFTCSCGDSYTEPVAALGHDMISVAAQAPTPNVDGWTAHQACSRCDHKVGYAVLHYSDCLFAANGAGYMTWAEAVATGDTTIELLNDVSVDELQISAGITLDLNGKTLNAANVASFGDIIDTVGGGAVKTNNLEAADNSYLPLRDGEVYRFFSYELVSLGSKGSKGSNAKVKFGFALNFADDSAYALIAAGADLEAIVTLSWGEESREFAFSAELVKSYAAMHIANPGRQAAMMLIVTGADALDAGTTLTLTPAVMTRNTQMKGIGTEMTYTVA